MLVELENYLRDSDKSVEEKILILARHIDRLSFGSITPSIMDSWGDPLPGDQDYEEPQAV